MDIRIKFKSNLAIEPKILNDYKFEVFALMQPGDIHVTNKYRSQLKLATIDEHLVLDSNDIALIPTGLTIIYDDMYKINGYNRHPHIKVIGCPHVQAELHIIVHNTSDKPFLIEYKDAIATIEFIKREQLNLEVTD